MGEHRQCGQTEDHGCLTRKVGATRREGGGVPRGGMANMGPHRGVGLWKELCCWASRARMGTFLDAGKEVLSLLVHVSTGLEFALGGGLVTMYARIAPENCPVSGQSTSNPYGSYLSSLPGAPICAWMLQSVPRHLGGEELRKNSQETRRHRRFQYRPPESLPCR